MRLFPRKDAQAGPERPPRPKVQVLGGIEPEFDAPETVRQRFMPLAVRRELSRLIWRGFAVLLFIVALVLALALVSHHPLDASANVATAASTQNWLGSFGAYVSDLLIQGFGIAAWGMPAIPLVWALAVARTLRIVAPLRRVLWAGLFLVALAVSLALILPTEAFAGGAAGFLIVSFLPWTLVKVLAFPLAFLGAVWAGGRAICFSMAALRAIFLTPSATLMMSADRACGVVRGGAGGLRWFWRLVRRTPAQGEAQPLDPSIPSFLSSGPESLDPFAAKATQPVTPAAQAYQPPFAEPPQQPTPWQELEPNAAFQAEAEAGFPTYHETLDDEPVPSQEQDPEGEYTAADETQGSAIAAQPKAKLVETPQQAKLRAEPVAKPATHKTASAATATYAPPSLDLLYEPTGEDRATAMTQEGADMFARRLEATLKDYGVKGEIVRVLPGPVVTLYELEPAPGTKTSRVVGLADDIARSMAALSARIAPVPGKSVIGIELPNPTRETVFLQELLADSVFAKSKAALPLALGKDIGGQSVMADLSKMPHLLVAGTTGSGKSVAVNTMILSLVYALSPEQVRFIMIDPKILELSVYDGIPHLLSPVVTDPKKAVVALKWVVQEMNQRYQNMSDLNVRNIANYNGKIQAALAGGETLTRQVQVGFCPDSGEPIMEEQAYNMRPLPHIVVVVDEMAELMLMVGKDIEAAIQSIAQKARAAGIHMIMATQRPSVDVITGTIKANFPSRISFAVSSKIDSRTVLNEMGAEQLLGQGDMLFQPNGGRTMRVHGPFASDDEVEAVVASLKQVGEPEYIEAITNEDALEAEAGPDGLDLPLFETESSGDDLYDQAVQAVLKDKKASTSHVQRRLQIGYNRAANLIDRMEDEGLITPADHVGRRKIIVPGDSAEA